MEPIRGGIDGVPHLHNDQQQGVPQIQASELGSEDGHGALECKAHVTSQVTGSICHGVTNTKLTIALFIQGHIFLSHGNLLLMIC